MKIKFKEDCLITLVDGIGSEMDIDFHFGDIQEGEILADHGEYVSFGDQNGWKIHRLSKTLFEEVES